MAKNAKVDLTLLKRLVGELESTLATAEGIKADTDSKDSETEYVVEMQKAAGLAAGVMTEATLLVGDIAVAVRSQSATAEKDPLAKILGAIKGNGGGLPGTN